MSKACEIRHVDSSCAHYKFNHRSKLVIANILHVPLITMNLLSISKCANNSPVIFEFQSDKWYVKSQDSKHTPWFQRIIIFPLDNFRCVKNSISDSHGFSTIVLKHVISNSNLASTSYELAISSNSNFLSLWYFRFGHDNFNSVKMYSFCVIYISQISTHLIFVNPDV